MSDMIEIVLLGGPLDGYHHHVEEVMDQLPLRVNGTPRGSIQHVYHHKGRDASLGPILFEYAGDDTSATRGLSTADAIDTPAEAFRDR